MEKNSSPMPRPAENSMASQEKVPNSGRESSAPRRMLPKRLPIRKKQMNRVAHTTRT